MREAITSQDVARCMTEAMMNMPNVETLSDGETAEFLSRELFMDPGAASVFIEAMVDAALMLLRINLERGLGAEEAMISSFKTTSVGALMMGIHLEREFGAKTDVGGVDVG